MSTAKVRPRNRRGEGSRLRDEIVQAATELLDETGDERAITLRSVARHIGIAAPSIYPHFPDQPAIMLAVVRRALDEFTADLRAAADAHADPVERLYAVCRAYLDFARDSPQRYRTMFGGLWVPALGGTSVTEADLASLGDDSLQLLATVLADCVAAGRTIGRVEPAADAVALWLGLHGLAHQRSVTRVMPGPADIEERIITALAHLR